MMKEFKLSAWPELPTPYHRTAYRRMLSDMSHRFVSMQQLADASGASKLDVRSFLNMLKDRGLLRERVAEAPPSIFGPIGGWLRKALTGTEMRH
jgi:hypothetical protein